MYVFMCLPEGNVLIPTFYSPSSLLLGVCGVEVVFIVQSDRCSLCRVYCLCDVFSGLTFDAVLEITSMDIQKGFSIICIRYFI